MKPRVSEEEAIRHLQLLGLPFLECRCIPADGPPVRAWFDNYEELAETVCGLSAVAEGFDVYAGIYVTENEIDPSMNNIVGMTLATGKSTGKENIVRIRTLTLDFDPVKPKNVPATDSENLAATTAAERAETIATEQGWAKPMRMSSGNGAYAKWRVDLPSSPASQALVERVLRAFAKLLDNDACRVDQTVHDPNRIFRLAGTINRKGVATADRPYRTARLISTPPTLELVTESQLREFADSVLGMNSANMEVFDEQFDHLTAAEFDKRLTLIVESLRRAGVTNFRVDHKGEGTAINFGECPFKHAGNKSGGAGIFVFRNGNRTFSCFHEKCRDRTIAELEKKLKLPLREVAEEMGTSEVLGDTKYALTDPLPLAKKHLARWATSDGTDTLAHFRRETHRYVPSGWETVQPGELDAWIRETVQGLFEQHAKTMSRILGEKVSPPAIRGQLVADVYKAMQSLCRYEITREAQAPFWLGPHGWNPNDLLVFRNGVLNVRHYLGGLSDYLLPLSPKLYFHHAATFEFNPSAKPPERWFAFLDSLGQDETWKSCLQQIMGYLIWCGYDLQKFFQFVGPTRAGKGIIAGVLKGLLGGEHSAGSLRLRDFATEFGLEDALDKRLIIVPEVTLPTEDVRNIVARIKAITGGDAVSVNRKNKKQITVRLPVKMLMLTNEFLVLPDNSGAVHGRTIPLKFTKSFAGNEDRTLDETLKGEYAGILNWALDGVRSLLAAGGRFTLPESSLNELDQLIMESAPLRDFVDECCELDSRQACQCQSLYQIYLAWHEQAHLARRR